MILVDTSVWIDHFRLSDGVLVGLLDAGGVLGHPWVTAELALGWLSQRDEILRLMRGLPAAVVADDTEVMTLIRREGLSGTGIGYVDAQLVASTRLTPDAGLWTKDKRLLAVADRLGLSSRISEP